MCFLTVGSKVLHSAFLLSLSRAPQLSQDIPADAGLLCDKATMLFAATKDRPCTLFRLILGLEGTQFAIVT
jgi:hypothetical protein